MRGGNRPGRSACTHRTKPTGDRSRSVLCSRPGLLVPKHKPGAVWDPAELRGAAGLKPRPGLALAAAAVVAEVMSGERGGALHGAALGP